MNKKTSTTKKVLIGYNILIFIILIIFHYDTAETVVYHAYIRPFLLIGRLFMNIALYFLSKIYSDLKNSDFRQNN